MFVTGPERRYREVGVLSLGYHHHRCHVKRAEEVSRHVPDGTSVDRGPPLLQAYVDIGRDAITLIRVGLIYLAAGQYARDCSIGIDSVDTLVNHGHVGHTILSAGEAAHAGFPPEGRVFEPGGATDLGTATQGEEALRLQAGKGLRKIERVPTCFADADEVVGQDAAVKGQDG